MPTKSKSPNHRGAPESIAQFAPRFIEGRLVGFEKDMRICLTPVPSPVENKTTVAYFPALAACCSTLEYFVALHRGNLNATGWQQVAVFAAAYLPQPDYDAETIRVLFQAFRHPVAHRGIASGVWVDQAAGPGRGRRLIWHISAGSKRPACQLAAETGVLSKDPPWPTPYSHRVHIHLGRLWLDIKSAAIAYAKEVAEEPRLQAHFEACMRRLYPK
jgi:hypothetical protein